MNIRSVKLSLIGALLLCIPLSIRSQSTSQAASPQQQPSLPQQQQQQQQQAVYVCPMHPEVKSNSAGSCPKCGMNLKLLSSAQASASQPRYGSKYFPNFELITQDGKTVRFYDDLLKDKLVAIDLIYTTCKYNCPVETALLAQVQKMLGDQVGKDIFFYSISIDPKHDTPEVLKAYAEKFKVGPGWTFLTGKEAEIELINNRQDRRVEALKGTAESKTLEINKGQYLFTTRCAVCHTIGHGDKVGPDLLGVTRAREREWLKRYIAVPDKMLAEQDPIAVGLFKKYKELRMPNMGLHEVDVATLIEDIEEQTKAQRGAESPEKKVGAPK